MPIKRRRKWPPDDNFTCSPKRGALEVGGYGAKRAFAHPTISDHARHAQKPTEADAAASHRRAIQRVVWKPRQESRNRDCAFEPRQCHPGALMGAGGKRKMPVRHAADV